MANTYTLIASNTLTTTAASVTFSSIPSVYTDLKLVRSVRTSAATVAGNDYISINGSGASFTGRRLYGDGSNAASDTVTVWSGFDSANNGTASTFSNSENYFSNAFGSNYKSYSVDSIQEQNGTTAYHGLSAGLWSNTAAITSITLTPDSGDYIQYSSFYLYGIKSS